MLPPHCAITLEGAPAHRRWLENVAQELNVRDLQSFYGSSHFTRNFRFDNNGSHIIYVQ